MAGRKPNGLELSTALNTMRADYCGAKRSGKFKRRRTGVPHYGAPADWHYRSEGDYLWMSEVSRDLDRNDVVIGQMIDRAVCNILQGGFAPDPQTGDEKLDADLKARAEADMIDPETCDSAGQLTFHEQERLALRDTFVAGDILPLPLEDGTMQLVESHRLRSPTRSRRNIVHGVEMDENRRRERYWFTKEPIDAFSRAPIKVSDLTPIDAKRDDGEPGVLHVMFPRGATQTRGVTALAPVIDAAGLHDDLQFAQLLKAQLNAFFLIVRNRGTDFDPLSQNAGDAAAGVSANDPDETRDLKNLGPGAQLRSLRGEEIKPWAPNTPNPEFFPHVKLVLTFLSINLGLPLCLALLDASETNFSGYRGAVDQARLGFRNIQQQLLARFHRPWWRLKVRYWATTDPALRKRVDAYDRLLAGARGGDGASVVNPFGHVWHVPGWPYIEPTKDATADLLRAANMQASPTILARERGNDWERIAADTVRDRALAIRLAAKEAIAINAEFKLEGDAAVSWRDLAPLPNANTVSVSMTASGDGSQSNQPQPNQQPEGAAA